MMSYLMTTAIFLGIILVAGLAFMLGVIAIDAWREVRLADAANLRAAVEAENESDDDIVGEHVNVPGGRTH